jgi:hypothetical protein
MLDFQRHLFDVLEKVLDNQNEILRRFQPIDSGNDHQIIFQLPTSNAAWLEEQLKDHNVWNVIVSCFLNLILITQIYLYTIFRKPEYLAWVKRILTNA